LRVAGIAGAGVPVVAVELITHTRAAHTALVDGARTQIRALGIGRATAGNRLIVASGRRIARQVRGAGIAVVAIERNSGRADAVLAALDAVADVGIAARLAVRHIGVDAAARRIAGVARAA